MPSSSPCFRQCGKRCWRTSRSWAGDSGRALDGRAGSCRRRRILTHVCRAVTCLRGYSCPRLLHGYSIVTPARGRWPIEWQRVMERHRMCSHSGGHSHTLSKACWRHTSVRHVRTWVVWKRRAALVAASSAARRLARCAPRTGCATRFATQPRRLPSGPGVTRVCVCRCVRVRCVWRVFLRSGRESERTQQKLSSLFETAEGVRANDTPPWTRPAISRTACPP